MARIETYPLDSNITVNDYVIGTDGDSLNATKNYKILTFLNYLGDMYNLNSTDLLFNYNNVDLNNVINGQVSTNNYQDGTILMSGVTNIYVSKVTTFGQLVDNIINTIGSENLTIMFTDMGNRNNLGIFTVNSTSDVNANTIDMSVTSSTSVGSISAGKVMGIRIGIGGSGNGIAGTKSDFNTALTDGDFMFIGDSPTAHTHVIADITDFTDNSTNWNEAYSWGDHSAVGYLTSVDIDNFVTLDTVQTITASKTFISQTTFDGAVFLSQGVGSIGLSNEGSGSGIIFTTSFAGVGDATFDFADLTVNRRFTFPDNTGTIALEGSFLEFGTNIISGTLQFKDSGTNQGFFMNSTTNETYIQGGSVGNESQLLLDDNLIRATVLAGTGDRMVVADSTGVLSTQSIPSGGSGGDLAWDSGTQTITNTGGTNAAIGEATNLNWGVIRQSQTSTTVSSLTSPLTFSASIATQTLTGNAVTINIRVIGVNGTISGANPFIDIVLSTVIIPNRVGIAFSNLVTTATLGDTGSINGFTNGVHFFGKVSGNSTVRLYAYDGVAGATADWDGIVFTNQDIYLSFSY